MAFRVEYNEVVRRSGGSDDQRSVLRWSFVQKLTKHCFTDKQFCCLKRQNKNICTIRTFPKLCVWYVLHSKVIKLVPTRKADSLNRLTETQLLDTSCSICNCRQKHPEEIV